MKHGIMKLVYNDETLRTRQYWGIQHRKDIIEYWRKFYGVKFAECFIHLLPEINWNAVRKNGKNMRFKKDKGLVDIYDVAVKKIKPKEEISKPVHPYVNRWEKAGNFFK